MSKPKLRCRVGLVLLSMAIAATLIAFAASASRMTGRADVNQPVASRSDGSSDQKPLSPLAPAITATLTDNTSTSVAPAGTISYTAVITNSAGAGNDATGVAYNHTIDSNTTLVAGSIHASPVAFNDTYNWVGNTFLDTTARSLSTVISNDVAIKPGGRSDTFSVTTITNGASTLGGTVNLAADGSFTYNPPVGRPNAVDGASVNDTFTYTIKNNTDNSLTATGTVTIALSGRVWYSQGGGSGDGRSGTPSGNPATMSTSADKSTDILYVFSSGSNLNGAFTLDSGQQLLGQGVALVVNSITLFTAGSAPTITNSTGTAVTLNASIGSNTITGFNVGNCSGSGVSGTNFGTVTVSSVSINNATSNALTLNNGTVTGSGFTSVSSAGGVNSISLTSVAGTLALGGGALSGASGNAFDVTGGAASISYSGTITHTAAARLINIANHTGGTVTFSGAISGSTSDTGINLSTNGGATISFTGGITLNGVSSVFVATGGGTSTTSSTNTIGATTAPTGPALNVANTTIGASGLNFQRISATGGVNGIVLNNTGSTGTFTVTGNAGTCTSLATCTGGAIQNATGAGISLTNTRGPSFDRMFIQNTGDNGVRGTTVTNFTMTNSRIDNWGTAAPAEGAGIGFNVDIAGATSNLDGTVTITGNTLTTGKHGIDINSRSGTISDANISSNSITPNTTTGSGIRFIAFATASSAANITKATLNANTIRAAGLGVQVQCGNASGTATVPTCGLGGANKISITNNDAQGTAAVRFTGEGLLALVNGRGTGNFDISGNTVKFSSGILISHSAFGFASVTSTINNNILDNCSVSGCQGIGVGVTDAFTTADTPAMTVSINGNTISNVQTGILGSANTATGTLNITIKTNTVTGLSGAGARPGIRVDSGNASSVDENVCVDIQSNTAAAIGGASGVGVRKQGTISTTNDFGIEGMGAGPNTAASVETFLSGLNPASTVGSNGLKAYVINGDNFVSCSSAPLRFAKGGVSPRLGWLSAGSRSNLNPTAFLSGDDTELGSLNAVATKIPAAGASLNQQQFDLLVSAAIARWSATGLTAKQLAAMRGIRFELADLTGFYLGEADGNVIRVDNDAAGNGWFIDPTPFEDSEFGDVIAATRRYTDPLSAPTGHLDLLTAVMHELGHRVGLPDTYALLTRDDLMYGYLVKGERRLPRQDQARNANPDSVSAMHFLSLLPEGLDLPITAGISESTNDVSKFVSNQIQSRVSGAGNSRSGQSQDKSDSPQSGELVSVNIGTLPATKSITIKYSVTVNTPPLARQISTQGTVSGSNFSNITTTDPGPPVVNGPTVTLIDTTATWNGATSTDWNTAANWTIPGGSSYAPGVSNPAVNDVVIPNVGAQPNIGTTDIGIFSLNISNGRTLTITNPRVLTIGGSPGGDLTLDGIISGGTVNFGTGTHNLTNAGGTGSLSTTNVATVLTGSNTTLSHNLQAGAFAVNSGGTLNITSRTLSLNGSGAALVVQGGSTFTITGSTVTFNGTAAQQAAGVVYNNLTINNTIGTNITGVTLTGNATVNGVLTLTSSDLDTGANTLTMSAAATSGPGSNATDVIGNVKRTGFVSGGAALSFGNSFNTIKINSGAAPTDITVNLVKSSPVGFSQSVQRTYKITPNGANGPATLRLHYLDTELNGNTPESSLNLRRFNGTGWQPFVATASNTADATNNWLENNNVSQCSPWTFSNFTPTAAPSTISGHIADANGRAIEGTTIYLSGTQTRKTITDAQGNYRFSDVEANGFYTVTPARVNYTFAPFNRSFTQLGEHTDAGFGASFTNDSFNPLDTPEYFVRQQYVDILGREPDEGGFNYWSDQINACNGDAVCIRSRRVGVAAAFFIEYEFKQTGSFIYDVYSGALGRRPGFAEYSADHQQVIGGPNLEAEKAAFALSFVQRPEFTQKYQSATAAESFVDALLQTVAP